VPEGQASWWIHRGPARRHDCCPATRSTVTSSSPPRDIGLPGLTLTRPVTGPNGVEVTGYPLAVLADHPASDNDKLVALAMLHAVVAAAAQAEASTVSGNSFPNRTRMPVDSTALGKALQAYGLASNHVEMEEGHRVGQTQKRYPPNSHSAGDEHSLRVLEGASDTGPPRDQSAYRTLEFDNSPARR
jgi:hypothetical protein